MPMFLLSFFQVPVGVRKRLDFYRLRFFWQGDGLKRKYRLAKWDIICRPKDQGGLGIENLEVKNRCLLSKWLWKLSSETEAMWAQILRSKYLQTKSLSQVTVRPTDSPFWKGLIKVKQSLFNRTKFVIGNGTRLISPVPTSLMPRGRSWTMSRPDCVCSNGSAMNPAPRLRNNGILVSCCPE